MANLFVIFKLLFRNAYCRNGEKAKRYTVNLEYYNREVNLGDSLAPVIYDWILNKYNIKREQHTKRSYHLMTVGSLIGGSGFFDAVIWGSGIKSFDAICSLAKRKYFQKFDIRAVRGPITRKILCAYGYNCPPIYGDPAILMPIIYTPKIIKQPEEKRKTGVILHFHSHDVTIPDECVSLSIKTEDYKSFIDSLYGFKKVISSSLHGIILAESYGVPTVFLCKNMDEELLKYYDWYYSTGRRNVKMANSIEQALDMEPMELPDLTAMQKNLLKAFPHDLWKN